MQLEQLSVPLVLDDTDYSAGLRRADENTGKFAENVSKKLDSIGDSVTGLGKKMSTGLTLPILAAGGASVLAASNLEQSIGGIEAVFGNAVNSIKEFGEVSATQAGLSERAFNEMSASTGALLINMGFSQEEAAAKTVELTQRAADMAATFGGPVADAMGAINSLLRGQADPIEKYGAGMTAVQIKAKALELGLGDLDGNIDEAAKTTARLALLNERTALTQGQFARETDTLSGQLEIQKAQLEDMGAEIGEILMPVILDIVEVISGWMQSFKELSPETKKMIVIVLGIVAALGPFLIVVGSIVSAIGTLIPIVTAVGGVIAGLAAGPVLLIIAGIAALIAIFVLLKENWGDITAFMSKKWDGFTKGFGKAIESVKKWINGLMDKLRALGDNILDAIPDWLIPGSPTPFEIGMKGIRKEVVKVDAEFSTRNFGQSLPNVTGNSSGNESRGADLIDYNMLSRTIAHELQLVLG